MVTVDEKRDKTIVSRFRASERIQRLADDYKVSPAQVENIIRLALIEASGRIPLNKLRDASRELHKLIATVEADMGLRTFYDVVPGALRAAALDRDGHRCVRCNAPAQQVHHLTYERWQDESLEDLESLCVECHEKEHNGG